MLWDLSIRYHCYEDHIGQFLPMDWRQKFTPIERRLMELSNYDKPETIQFASKYELSALYQSSNITGNYPIYMESFTINPKADGKMFWVIVRCNSGKENHPIPVWPTDCSKFLRKSMLLDKNSRLEVEH